MGKVYVHPFPRIVKVDMVLEAAFVPMRNNVYHARKAAAARSISTLTNRGEGGRRYHTNAFASGTLFRRNQNKESASFHHTHNSDRGNYEWD